MFEPSLLEIGDRRNLTAWHLENREQKTRAFHQAFATYNTTMGVEAAPGNKSKGSSIVKGSTDPKNPPTNPPVRQFANQLQQDIEDVTVEVIMDTPLSHTSFPRTQSPLYVTQRMR